MMDDPMIKIILKFFDFLFILKNSRKNRKENILERLRLID